MHSKKIGVALLLAAALGGCGNEAGVYDLPAATVFERLNNEDMSDFRLARQCGILIHFSIESQNDRQVRWIVTSGGAQVASFSANLTPLDANRTRVTIDVPGAPGGGEIYDGTKFYPRPALHQPLRPAIAELIDARLAQRPFDVWRIPDGLRVSENDSVCSVQRAGLESGSVRFTADGKDEGGLAGRRGETAPSGDNAGESQ